MDLSRSLDFIEHDNSWTRKQFRPFQYLSLSFYLLADSREGLGITTNLK